MKRTHTTTIAAALAALVAAAAAGGAWFYHSRGADAAASAGAIAGAGAGADTAGEAAAQASVLAQTAPVQRRAWPLTLEVYGEVAAARPETLSFPQAGRLVRLDVVTGQRVRRGEALATLESDPAARAVYAQAASAVDFARRELARNSELLALQLATQAQVDTAAKQLQDAESALAAQAKLGGAGATAVVAAPFDAVVTAVTAVRGDRLAAGAAVLQLAGDDGLRVLLSVDPAAIGALRPGMPLTLDYVGAGAAEQADQPSPAASASKPASASGTASKPIRGSIATVQGLVDPKTQMSGAIARLAAGSGLAPGTRVTARIALGQRQAWSVPRSAVLNDEQGSYLFQVEGKAGAGRARRIAVRKVAETPAAYGVDGPLDGALPVVVLGNYELQDGGAVRGAAR